MNPRTLVAALLTLGALAVACSDDNDNAEPGSPTFNTSTGGSAGSGGSTAGSGGSVAGSGGSTAGSGGSPAGAGGSTAGSGGSTAGSGGSTAGSGGSAAGSGGAAGSCDGANGCYACTPVTLEQHLNQCTDSQCVPFDNAARLPLFNGGNLPPIP